MSDLTYGIVIPAYQAAHTLKRCLDSIFQQKYKEKSVVCVLDGPDEAATAVLKEYPAVKVITLETNQGACHARNIGAQSFGGKTDLLLFWDADCYMEPGALQDWANVLTKYPEVDFTYSDYRFTVAELGAMIAEEFDPWLLKCNNFISTMTPVRTKANPIFDESINSLQDWDLWLTLVEKGHKGKYLPGIRFITSPPTKTSISGQGCRPDEWMNRKNIIKRKHSIQDNPICVTSLSCPERAMEIAKQLGNADFSRDPSFNKHEYKMVYLLGFYAQDAINHSKVFRNGPDKMVKVIHWLGSDVDSLYQLVPLQFGFQLGDILGKEYINLCETARMKSDLKKIGIDAEIIKLPVTSIEPIKDESLSKDFQVLYDVDKPYKAFMKTVVDAMPDIKFDDFTKADIGNYSLFIRLTSTGVLDEACKKFLCSGKRIITNIAEPYAGYIEDNIPEVVIKRITKDIRAIQGLFLTRQTDNTTVQALEYYRTILSWDNYKTLLNAIMQRGLLWKMHTQTETAIQENQGKGRSFLSSFRSLMGKDI